MRKTRAATQSQRAIGHIAALQFIATMFVMHAMVGRSTLEVKMPRLDAYPGNRSWMLLPYPCRDRCAKPREPTPHSASNAVLAGSAFPRSPSTALFLWVLTTCPRNA